MRKRGERGAPKAPTEMMMSIRPSPAVVEAFKATGKGWQGHIDEALTTYLREHPLR